MARQISPFAELTGAEKQIKWLEYQSIRLPYTERSIEQITEDEKKEQTSEKSFSSGTGASVTVHSERPQPPPEIPRVMPDFSKTRHSQYDAVIARLKQAELQSQRFHSIG